MPLKTVVLASRAKQEGGGPVRSHSPLVARDAGQHGIRSLLLGLQHTHGNQRVQRLIALARQGEGACDVAPTVESAIAQARGRGQTLERPVKVQMESAFGADFTGVRVHCDSVAHSLNSDLQAIAFTSGSDIFFSHGAYDPASSAGRLLLAHELTHVVQQRAGSSSLVGARSTPVMRVCACCEQDAMGRKIQAKMAVSQPYDPDEIEADEVARRVTAALDAPVAEYCEGVTSLAHHAETRTGADGPAVLRQEFVGVAPAYDLDDVSALAQPMRGVARPTVSRAFDAKIHRAANFVAGAVHPVNNVAVQIVTQGPAGLTWHMLNGSRMTTVAAADSAVQRPTLGGRSLADGTAETWIVSTPTNIGTFDETVLSGGPWSTVSTKGVVGARLGLATCSGGDPCTLTANGSPSDAAIAAANRTHEDHHAADHEAAFNAVFGPWDGRVAAAQRDGTRFSGPDPAAAEAALWAAMGGTPEAIAETYRADGFARGAAFHATRAGGPLVPFNPVAGANCDTATVSVR